VRTLILAHRYRLAQQLRLMPDRLSPGALVFDALTRIAGDRTATGAPPGPGRPNPALRPWTSSLSEVEATMRETLGADFAMPQPPACLRDVRRCALKVKQNLGYGMWRTETDGASNRKLLGVDSRSEPAFSRVPPNSHSQHTHLHWLFALGHYDVKAKARGYRAAALMGIHVHATPASTWAPSCSGTPLALCTRSSTAHASIILWTRAADVTLRRFPFYRGSADPDSDADADVEPPTCPRADADSTRPRQPRSLGIPVTEQRCMHCSDVGKHHLWHLALECQHPHVVQYRRTVLQPAAYQAASRLVDLLAAAHPKSPGARAGNPLVHTATTRQLPAALTQARADLKAAIRVARGAQQWDSPDWQHLTYRLLTCAPIAAFDVRARHPHTILPQGCRRLQLCRCDTETPTAPTADDAMPALLAFARAHDAAVLPNSKLRPWANEWVTWSTKHIVGLAGVHRCGLSRTSGPQAGTNDAQVPCPLCRPEAVPLRGGSEFDLHDRPGRTGGDTQRIPSRATAAAGGAGAGVPSGAPPGNPPHI
jgi:hypothetical protein